ncbi:MAG: YvcK family protein [Planctomycetes bacterium]|nr:YvcK family protein [Planctomycetota bacterium]
MRIVTLGGGTGQAQLLRGLARRKNVDLTAIAGVTDNGGHSGRLREQYGLPAVGDLRQCLSALASDPAFARGLEFRFTSGDLEGACAGNVLLAALTMSEGSLARAAGILRRRAGIAARVLPVSDASSQVCAELADGRVIRGEWNIMRREPRTPIARLFHDPPLAALPPCLAAARRADLVVLGPGSLRTAIVSLLLAGGLKEALRSTRVAYVLNILSQPGQTDGFTAEDHVNEVARYLGRPPDVVIANTRRPPEWAKEGAEFVAPEGIDAVRADLLERVDRSAALTRRRPARFVSGPHLVRHDPAKLVRAILKEMRRYEEMGR